MTDDQMHARLGEAGERWRGVHTATADPDGEELVFVPSKPSHHRRWLALASAAVIAVALVIGGVVWATQQHHSTAPPATKSSITELEGVTWTNAGAFASLVFLPGAVRVSGMCYTENHRLVVSGDQLTVGEKFGPGYLCGGIPVPKSSEALIKRYDRVLRGPSTWLRTGDHLILTARTGESITLTTDGSPAPTLVGMTWTLDRVLDGHGHGVKGVFNDATLAIDPNNRFVANDLCHSLSGTAHWTLDMVDFSKVATSANACVPSQQATAIIDTMLSGTTRYQIVGEEMFLTKPGYRGQLEYHLQPSGTVKTPVTLTGQTWNLTSVQFGDDVYAQPAAPITQSHLTFFGATYEATHRCYTRAGSSSIADGSMTLTGSRSIDVTPCPQTVGEARTVADGQENQAVDAILDGTVQWTLRGNTLTLHKDGAGTLVYRSTGTGTTTVAAKFGDARWRLISIDAAGASSSMSGSTDRVFLEQLAKTIVVTGCTSPGIGFISISDGQLGVSDFRYSSPCQNPLLSASDRAALTSILSGKLTWSITGNELTITKPGVGALGFVRK